MTHAQTLERPRRPFSVDEVDRMVEIGILREDEPLELLNGELTFMPPQGAAHSFVNTRLSRRLLRLFPESSHSVFDGKPLQLDARSLPEPDIAVLTGTLEEIFQHRSHPQGRDAVLVVEIAWSSQTWDRKKARAYARGGVPAYWLIDLAARRIEVYTQPGEDGQYQTVQILTESDDITVPTTDAVWSVSELLPPELS